MSDEKWDILLHSTLDIYLTDIVKKRSLIPSNNNLKKWLKITNKFYPQKIDENKSIIKQLIKNNGKFTLREYYDKLWETSVIPPAVYCSYMFSDSKYEGKSWAYPFQPDILIAIDTKILKDKPWIACDSVAYGWCVYEDIEKGYYGEGELKRKPNMKKIQDNINKRVKEGDDYQFTNEVLLDEVPFEYIKAILVTRSKYKKVKEIFQDTEIPVIMYAKTSKDYKKILSVI